MEIKNGVVSGIIGTGHKNIRSVQLLDHQVYDVACMDYFVKSIQCGKTAFTEMRFAFARVLIENMLSDINRKRTPDYVLKSIREILK